MKQRDKKLKPYANYDIKIDTFVLCISTDLNIMKSSS